MSFKCEGCMTNCITLNRPLSIYYKGFVEKETIDGYMPFLCDDCTNDKEGMRKCSCCSQLFLFDNDGDFDVYCFTCSSNEIFEHYDDNYNDVKDTIICSDCSYRIDDDPSEHDDDYCSRKDIDWHPYCKKCVMNEHDKNMICTICYTIRLWNGEEVEPESYINRYYRKIHKEDGHECIFNKR